jgi:di/tricarboxylate transporter
MNIEIAIVLAILFATIALFVVDKLGADVVSLLAVLALLLTGTLQTQEALAGFGNPAVLTIASIFLVTAGLTNTGVAGWIGRRLLRIAGESESRLVAVTMAVAATLSLVMNNIASASVLLPGLSSIARQTKISSSKLLIPLSFGTFLGGMATLFTTTNILVNDALHERGLAGFTLLDFFRIGSLLTIAGIAFMVVIGRKLLPDYVTKEITPVRRLPADLAQLYQVPELLFEARILAASPLDGKTVAQSQLGQTYNLNIIGILRGGRIKLSPPREEMLRAGDRLLLEGDDDLLRQTQENLGLVCDRGETSPSVDLADRDIGIVEVVISPYADVVGSTLRDIHFREKFGLTVLALRRDGRPVRQGVPDLPLRFGDALLVQGPRPRLRILRTERNFILLDEPELAEEAIQPDKAPWALLAMALMLTLSGFGVVRIATASLLAAMLMVVSGALKMEEGYRAIEWKAVVMIGGMLSMGTALTKSGAASLLSQVLLHALAPLGHLSVLAGYYILSLFLTQAISGAATAVILAPIALSGASQMGISPYPLLMTVILGTSSAFLTPVSHPANILVMGPGGYKFNDYARVGSVLSAIVFVMILVLVPLFWPF